VRRRLRFAPARLVASGKRPADVGRVLGFAGQGIGEIRLFLLPKPGTNRSVLELGKAGIQIRSDSSPKLGLILGRPCVPRESSVRRQQGTSGGRQFHGRPGGSPHSCLTRNRFDGLSGTERTDPRSSDLPRLGEFDFDPQLDLAQHGVESRIA
jgi:hypothetical protein